MLVRIERVLGVLWIGGLWTIGYVVAPVLFMMLPKIQAGEIAGRLFSIIGFAGLVIGLALALIARWRGTRLTFWLLVAMWVSVVIGVAVLQPVMGDLKAQGLIPGTDAARTFGILHGVSSLLYLLTSVLGLGYVIIRPDVHTVR